MTWGQILTSMARHIGISDQFIAECPWIEHWMQTNREHLVRNELSCRWHWHD